MTDIFPRSTHRGRRACFVVSGRLPIDKDLLTISIDLPPRVGQALAILASLLMCGEEAAAIAFDDLAEQDDTDAAAALRHIAQDERRHEAWLFALVAALPVTPRRPGLMAKARAFHIELAEGGAQMHFARIAALDSAVCLVLSRLTRADGPLAAAPQVRRLLSEIRDDEARHVAIARQMVCRYPQTQAVRAAAETARASVAAIFDLAHTELALLGVDADTLIADVRRLPAGLLAA